MLLELIKGKAVVPAVTAGIIAIGGLITTIWTVDDRYVKAEDFKDQKAIIMKIEKQSSKTLEIVRAQMLTRKTILEMREASGNLTVGDKVELKSLRNILDSVRAKL